MYHRQSLDALDRLIPTLQEDIGKAVDALPFILNLACCFQDFTVEPSLYLHHYNSNFEVT